MRCSGMYMCDIYDVYDLYMIICIHSYLWALTQRSPYILNLLSLILKLS